MPWTKRLLAVRDATANRETIMGLKAGTETGSLINYLLSLGGAKPEVGMGCTILGWTDRHAATIVKVTKTQVHVQRDIATRIDKNGMSESQTYSCAADPTADVEVFRVTKKGLRNNRGNGLSIGKREEYYDHGY